MKWLSALEENETIPSNISEEISDFKIRALDNEETLVKEFSILTQFFVLLSAQDENSMTSLSLPHRKITKKTLREIVAHFNSRKVVLEHNKPVEIMLTKPNKESIAEIRSCKLNPIVKSLYGSINNDLSYEWRPQKVYKLHPQFIEKFEDDNFYVVLNFLQETSNNSLITLQLYDWNLEESLIKNLAIRYLAHKCKNVYLWIDEKKRITTIQLEL